MYGSNAELEERGIDPTQLLKLIKTEEEFEDDELAYSDAEDSENSTCTLYSCKFNIMWGEHKQESCLEGLHVYVDKIVIAVYCNIIHVTPVIYNYNNYTR